jgi:hypothetical protein
MTNDIKQGEWKDVWTLQFTELEIWLLEKGYCLEIANDVVDCVYLKEKIVCIQARSGAENRYYSLLHECGHILVAQGSEQWARDMPMYAQDPTVWTDARRRRSKKYKVSVVAEEIEAWKRGRRMAKKMEHYIDNDSYNKLMADCVYSYIEMVATTAYPP